jgi:hypothetical protein
MKFAAALVAAAMIMAPTVAGAQGFEPCFFFDFDDDGVADELIVDHIDLGQFEPATLYVGIEWPGRCDPLVSSGLAAAEYRVIYTGLVTPGVSTYAEPGAPDWALSIGSMFDGGWFQAGPCRDGCPEFIAALSVTGTGSYQTFDFAPTSSPYEFPGLIQAYDCLPEPHGAGVINNAACNGFPNSVPTDLECVREPTSDEQKTWGELKKMFN